jgi:two-component sensor histidine kinase
MPELPSNALQNDPRGAVRPGLGISGACADCNLLVEADHRIANHLAMLRSYLHLKGGEFARQRGEVSRESVGLILASLDAQIVAVSQLHRALATHGRQTSTDLAEQLHATCLPFLSGLSGETKITEDFESGCRVEPDQVLPLTQIVGEALTNALKHGQRPGHGGAICVRCHKVTLGGVLIEIVDDGPGFPPGFDPMTDGGLGFRLLRGLSKQLGAMIAFKNSRDGVSVRLTLPAAPSLET